MTANAMTTEDKGGEGPDKGSEEAAPDEAREYVGPRAQLEAALDDPGVIEVAKSIAQSESGPRELLMTLRLGLAMARAFDDDATANRLEAELTGYGDKPDAIPDVRRAVGFASPFPVRALDLGLLDPEEIFSASNEKFSKVTLTIDQPIAELEEALTQIREGGVLALKVPAGEVTHRSAQTAADTMVYIYILPLEIEKIVESARTLALESLLDRLVSAAASST